MQHYQKKVLNDILPSLEPSHYHYYKIYLGDYYYNVITEWDLIYIPIHVDAGYISHAVARKTHE